MYIDKIYTKLYSERDWNGLKQLVSEIKLFSKVDRKTEAYKKLEKLNFYKGVSGKKYRSMGKNGCGVKLWKSDDQGDPALTSLDIIYRNDYDFDN